MLNDGRVLRNSILQLADLVDKLLDPFPAGPVGGTKVGHFIGPLFLSDGVEIVGSLNLLACLELCLLDAIGRIGPGSLKPLVSIGPDRPDLLNALGEGLLSVGAFLLELFLPPGCKSEVEFKLPDLLKLPRTLGAGRRNRWRRHGVAAGSGTAELCNLVCVLHLLLFVQLLCLFLKIVELRLQLRCGTSSVKCFSATLCCEVLTGLDLSGGLGKLCAELLGLLAGPLLFEGCGGCTFLLLCCCLLESMCEVMVELLSLTLHLLFSGGTREECSLCTFACNCFFL